MNEAKELFYPGSFAGMLQFFLQNKFGISENYSAFEVAAAKVNRFHQLNYGGVDPQVRTIFSNIHLKCYNIRLQNTILSNYFATIPHYRGNTTRSNRQ